MKTTLRCFALLLALSMIFAAVPFSVSAKSISQMKIVAFGDSLTHYGNTETGTNDEYGNLIYNNAYPEYLQKLLGASVYNAGVGGNTTDMAIGRMQDEIINQNPDVVVICLAMNDQAYAVAAKSVLVPLERYRANLETLAKTVSAAGKTATAQTGKYENGVEICQGWFCGFFPAENPRYTVTVFSENTKNQTKSCSEIFAIIADEVTNYKNLQ